MKRRPIFWGVIGLLVGSVGWVFAVILSVLTLGKFNTAANFFGYLFLLSIPLSLVGELLLRIFKKNK